MNALASTKTLIIAGPTASGKTNLALSLADKLPADLISADSRQVYQDLNIIPGKDVPDDFKRKDSPFTFQNEPLSIYTDGNTSLFGYDMVAPDADWSVSLFNQLCSIVVPHLWQKNRLPIIVGGTGFYLQSLNQPIDTLHIPPNDSLRQKLESLVTNKLQEKLKDLRPDYFASLNRSDKHNPRRLIRAIEVGHFRQQNPNTQPDQFLLDQDTTKKILLTAPHDVLRSRIEKRVQKRFSQDWQSELNYLQKLNLDWSQPSATSLGYRQLSKYQTGELTQKQALKIWAQKEIQYAKSQLSWFADQPGFKEVDITKDSYPQKVVDSLSRWYSKN